MQQSIYAVTGMTCSHCVSAVRSEVAKIPGVRDVAVDLDAGKLTVMADEEPELAAVRVAVEEAGYELAG
jgi:copper chaperone CopZ